MTFKTIHTNYGLQRMAQAEASGTPINLVAVSVGDGGGNPTTPSATQTQLVREMYRTTPNRVYQDPTNPQLFTVEMVVPATVGGFTIREIAAWDDQGSMFTVANVPDAYKPQGDGSEGSYGDTIIRMQFLATNASVVTLAVDPNVAVATQQWIQNTITLPYLLKGGTTGQVLLKHSNADGDVAWGDPTVANVAVSTVEEDQVIAVGQTVINLTKTTTVGLAIYIEGTRLKATDWTPDPVVLTRLTLNQNNFTQAVNAILVQNEPAAFVPNPLVQSKNLSDVADVPTARANLSVYSKAETDQKMQPGGVCFYAMSTAPAGWLKANGAAISRTAYAALFAAIGTAYGAGDGFNTFNLPDLRGEFLRGWDDSRGIDSGRLLGSWQANAFGSHNHGVNDPGHGHGVSDPGHGHGVNDGGHNHGLNDPGHSHVPASGGSFTVLNGNGGGNGLGGGGQSYSFQGSTNQAATGISVQGARTGISIQGGGTGIGIQGSATGISTQAAGSNETRPRNVALLACIKY